MTSLREMKAIANWHLGRSRYLFIHIPKNAGVSVRKSPLLAGRLLSADPYFHKSRDYTRTLAEAMRRAGEHHGFQHARWRDVNPKVTARLQSVALLRNPWARTVSRWRFAQLVAKQGKTPDKPAAASLEAFLEERHLYGNKPFYWHRAVRGWYDQADYVTDEQGNIRADLLRFECLDDDFMRYFSLDEPIRKRNITAEKRQDYRELYTPRTIQIVADWYARDIELFGFDFDSPATRNVVYEDAMGA